MLHAGQLDFRACQTDIRGKNHQPLDRGFCQRVLERRFARQHFVNGQRLFLDAHAQAAGCIALRVRVYDQHALALRRYAGGEIDAGGRFADAALLIGDCNDSSHDIPQRPSTLGASVQNKK